MSKANELRNEARANLVEADRLVKDFLFCYD